MKKLLSMAALALVGAVMTGCTNEDNLADNQQDNIVTVTTTVGLDDADSGATRALSIDYENEKATKTFAVGDQVALVYENADEVTVKATSQALQEGDISDGGKSATLTFTLTNPKTSQTVYYYYPAALVNESGSLDIPIATQDGTLAGLQSLDYAYEAGNLSGTTLELVTLGNKFAVVAFTLKDATGTNDITSTITSMTISAGAENYTVTGHDADGHIYVIMRPVTAEETITITATDGEKNYTKTLTGKTYAANNFYQQGLRMTDSTPLTVEALTAGTVKVNIYSSLSTGMKYALNGGAKTLITTITNIPVSAGDKVQFYGNGTETQRYFLSLDNGVRIQGEGDGFTCKVYGNIMSLLDETGFATKTTMDSYYHNCFRELFRGNTALTDASGLLLPATTLTNSCYHSMFYGCTALTTAPVLPATTLAEGCYNQMFYNCSALAAAPALPATTLAKECYALMFHGCTALTTAPDLLAPTLVNSCYNCMFLSCTNLNYVKCLATSGIDENSSTNQWLKDVAATGNFAAANDATWPENSTSGIPSGWSRRNPDGSAISHALSSAVVGEIIGSDGMAYAAADKDFLPSGVTAVAVVAYVGSEGCVDVSSATYRGLAIAMSDANGGEKCSWHSIGNCVSQTKEIATALGYLNGIACTETLVNSNGTGVTTNCSGHNHEAAIAARSNNGTSAPAVCSYWFLPSMGQWQLIVQGLTGKSDPLATTSNSDFNSSNVNPIITAAGGTGLISGKYLSSTEYQTYYVWGMHFGEGRTNGFLEDWVRDDYVRAVLAF